MTAEVARFPSMKHIVLSLFGIFLTVISSEAATVSLRSNFDVGYRQDRLAWSIAGNMSGNNPNVLSELEWKVDSIELAGDIWLLSAKNHGSAPFIRFWGNYGFIYDGNARDSDYQGDNRTAEYSRMECTADNGYVYDFAGAIGWEFAWQTPDNRNFSAAPFMGYSTNVQNLSLSDGKQVITSRYSPPPGPIPGLDSNYTAEWRGPLAGLHFRYTYADALTLWMEGLYHQVDYEGEAEWNLRTDFAQNPSFRQVAEGNGWTFSGGGFCTIDKRHSIGANLSYRKWTADEDGVDTVYFSNGSTAETHFNEAEWDAWSISLRYVYQF